MSLNSLVDKNLDLLVGLNQTVETNLAKRDESGKQFGKQLDFLLEQH